MDGWMDGWMVLGVLAAETRLMVVDGKVLREPGIWGILPEIRIYV